MKSVVSYLFFYHDTLVNINNLSIEETQKLQDMLRQKESDLEKTEDLLNSFQQEVHLLSRERKRLLGLQNNLELELETSAQAHKQLAEQKTENEKLKEIIDTLKTDLDEALYLQSTSSPSVQFMDALEDVEGDKEGDEQVVTMIIKRRPSSILSVNDESSHALGPASVAPIKVNTICFVLPHM